MSAGYDVFPGITQLPVEYDKVKISLLFSKPMTQRFYWNWIES